MLRLIWSLTARRDIRGIAAYIAERNPTAAEKLTMAIERCAERLPAHPYMYRTGRVPGTRDAMVHPNYLLVYRVTAETVEIVRVMHTRRQYPPSGPDDQPS